MSATTDDCGTSSHTKVGAQKMLGASPLNAPTRRSVTQGAQVKFRLSKTLLAAAQGLASSRGQNTSRLFRDLVKDAVDVARRKHTGLDAREKAQIFASVAYILDVGLAAPAGSAQHALAVALATSLGAECSQIFVKGGSS